MNHKDMSSSFLAEEVSGHEYDETSSGLESRSVSRPLRPTLKHAFRGSNFSNDSEFSSTKSLNNYKDANVSNRSLPGFYRHSIESGKAHVRSSGFGSSFGSKSSTPGRLTMPARCTSRAYASVEEMRHKFGQNVWSEKVDLGDLTNYIPPSIPKSNEIRNFIRMVLKSIFLLADLTSTDYELFINAMSEMKVEEGKVIINQGDRGDYFYIIESGKVSYFVGEKYVGSGGKGNNFGELALIYNCPRTASCVAESNCKLWRIDQKTFRYIMMHSSHTSNQKLIEILKRVNLFFGFTEEMYQKLADTVTVKAFSKGDEIISRGEVGNSFYVVQKGNVLVQNKGEQKHKSNNSNNSILGVGLSFGERSLITGEARSASVVALDDDCELLCLQRKDFLEIFGKMDGLLERARWSHILMTVPQFADAAKKGALFSLDTDTLKMLSEAMNPVTFEADEIIVKKGDVGDTLFIIDSGKVAISQVSEASITFDVSDRVLGPNDFFGERSLFAGELRSATVTALTKTKCRCLERKDAEKILNQLSDLLDRARWRRILLSIPQIFESELLSNEMDLIIDSVQKKRYKKGEIISDIVEIEKRSIYLVFSGRIKAKYGKKHMIHSAGMHFGDDLIKSSSIKSKGGTLEFMEDTMCGILSVKYLKRMLLRFNTKSIIGITLESFNVFSKLGSGSFGEVYLVNRDDDKDPCALKIMSKRRILEQKQDGFILGERKVLSQVDHPFLIKLHASFQNDVSLFLLTPVYIGGDIYNLLRNSPEKRIPLESATFYCACLLEGLAYMHDRNIIHRDIKCENLMIDNDGYVVIIDFGFAKKVDHKTFTVCGTPFYMAPEVLLSKGYHKSVDYWAMGVVFYEMLLGFEPFYAEDEIGLYQHICSCKYYLPSSQEDLDRDAAKFLKSIFTRVQKRIGCQTRSDRDARDHKVFAKLNWELLKEKSITAPSIPDNKLNMEIGKKTFPLNEVEEKRLSRCMSRKFSNFGPYINYSNSKESIQEKNKLNRMLDKKSEPTEIVETGCSCTIS